MNDTKYKTQKVLPKTAAEIANGGLYKQAIRCGKANCKCNGGDKHTAFYFFTRRAGKLVKIYVRRADLGSFSGLVTRSILQRRKKRQVNKTSIDLLRKFRADLFANENVIETLRKGKKRK